MLKFVDCACALIAKKLKFKYLNTSSEIMCFHIIHIDKIIALPSLTHFDMHFITYLHTFL